MLAGEEAREDFFTSEIPGGLSVGRNLSCERRKAGTFDSNLLSRIISFNYKKAFFVYYKKAYLVSPLKK